MNDGKPALIGEKYNRKNNISYYEKEELNMELLMIFVIYCSLFFAAGVVILAILGILLLIDCIFKTNIGRDVCKKMFF